MWGDILLVKKNISVLERRDPFKLWDVKEEKVVIPYDRAFRRVEDPDYAVDLFLSRPKKHIELVETLHLGLPNSLQNLGDPTDDTLKLNNLIKFIDKLLSNLKIDEHRRFCVLNAFQELFLNAFYGTLKKHYPEFNIKQSSKQDIEEKVSRLHALEQKAITEISKAVEEHFVKIAVYNGGNTIKLEIVSPAMNDDDRTKFHNKINYFKKLVDSGSESILDYVLSDYHPEEEEKGGLGTLMILMPIYKAFKGKAKVKYQLRNFATIVTLYIPFKAYPHSQKGIEVSKN